MNVAYPKWVYYVSLIINSKKNDAWLKKWKQMHCYIKCYSVKEIIWLYRSCKQRAINVHDNINKWKHFLRNWPFVREIYRSPMESPSALEQAAEQTIESLVIRDAITLIMTPLWWAFMFSNIAMGVSLGDLGVLFRFNLLYQLICLNDIQNVIAAINVLPYVAKTYKAEFLDG